VVVEAQEVEEDEAVLEEAAEELEALVE